MAAKVQSRLSQSSGPAEAAPVMVSVAPVSAPVAAKLEGRQCPCGHVAHRGEVPGVGRVVDGQRAARDSGGLGQLGSAVDRDLPIDRGLLFLSGIAKGLSSSAN